MVALFTWCEIFQFRFLKFFKLFKSNRIAAACGRFLGTGSYPGNRMFRDFHLALRGFRRNPGLIAAAILTFALGAGANTAIFSVIESALLRPLPLRDPASIAILWETNPKVGGPVAMRLPVADRNFLEWRARVHSFEEIEALRRSVESLTGEGAPESVTVARVTPAFFTLLGRGAWRGRTFQPGDGAPGRPAVAVLSAPFFARRFHGDPGALGRKLILNGARYVIAGVMPLDFHLPALRQGLEEIRPDVWLPLAAESMQANGGASRRNYVFARLRAGVSIESARGELGGLARQLEREYPRLDAGFGSSAYPATVEDAAPSLRNTVLSLEAAALFVLLMACANVAHLLLTRASGSNRETAIRVALGASPAQIARATLAECLVIGITGGALGVLWARGAIAGIDMLAPESPYRLHELTLNWRVLVFSLAATLCATLLFGLAPALASAFVNPSRALAQDARTGASRGALRLRAGLAVAQTAFAVILLAGAGLMIRSMANLRNVDPGFNAEHILTLRVQLPPTRYADAARVREFCNRLLGAASAIPGVRAAAISTSLPIMDALSLASYRVAGEPESRAGERAMADFKGVSEDYFAATGTALLRGRAFTREDAQAPSPQVAIVNDALARELAPFGDPLGRALVVGNGPKTIVGIVAGARQMGLDTPQRPEMFLPTRSIASMALLLRTTGDPMTASRAAMAAVRAGDPEQPMSNLRSMEEHIRRGAGQRRFDAALFAAFAALALLLAALGLYGVLSHSVVLRTREIGVRMALGARPAAVKWLVLSGALRLTLIGIAAGTVGALALTRCLRGLLFGVGSADPATFAIAAAALVATAAAAAYLPAARAARLDPLRALRRE